MKKNTEYQISASINEGILEIILTGEVTESATEKLKDEIPAILIANAIEYVMVDVRALKGHVSYGEIYTLARKVPRDMYRFNIALVDNPENADFESFHETTAINAGMSLKWFSDIDTARTWLKSKQRNGAGASL